MAKILIQIKDSLGPDDIRVLGSQKIEQPRVKKKKQTNKQTNKTKHKAKNQKQANQKKIIVSLY